MRLTLRQGTQSRAQGSRPERWDTLGRPAGVCLLTFVAATIAGGGSGFWLCLPAALLLSMPARTPARAALGAALPVVAAAGAVALSGRSLPSVPLFLLVVGLSATVGYRLLARARREREGLRASALTDPLTGVANRRAMIEWVDYEVARHDRLRSSFALVALDLDGFKLANDRFGHPAGEELLRDVGVALARSVREQDTVARMGGDEFCILAPETDEPGAERLVERVEVALSRVTAGVEALGASIGVALFPGDGATAHELLAAADSAQPAARRRGRASARRAA